jgi:asparagine synthase (glutamine-hydrolysing)
MIEEFEQGKLFSEENWSKHTDKLRSQVKPTTKKQVEAALIEAIKKRIPSEKFGVFLSGGVDSSLIAFILNKLGAEFTCYSVGIKESKDLEGAKEFARQFDLVWKHKIFTFEEVEEIARKTKKIFDKPDVVNVGVGSVIYACVELAKQDGVTLFFGGLGSEEIFAGYQRHEKVKDVNEECWQGLKSMWQRDLTRDYALAKALGIRVLCPFLDDELIITAMGISGEEKIKNGHKKAVLREIAEEMGLPKEIAWREKRAAQYGSGFDKAFDKLAKQKKISKREYIKSL